MVSEVSVYVPVPCVGPGDLKQLQALCFGVPAGDFLSLYSSSYDNT